jgi:type 1 glutamine amidotransferase
MARFTLIALLAALVMSAPGADAANVDGGGKRIVLIGGKKSHGPGEHDFAAGLTLLKRSLETARNVTGVVVDCYPDAWPADSAKLDGASAIVWYFDGIQQVPHPLLDAERLKAFSALMAKGVGLVCLHQASSLPADNTSIPLPDWIGGCRYGMVDRANTMTAFAQEHADHAVCRGWSGFSYKDEVYPTVKLSGDPRLVATLTAVVPPEKPARHVIAWTFERAGGGRSFAFTGGHYTQSWAVDEVRRMVLNAMLWTAGIEVPAGGVVSTVPDTK